MELRQLRSFCAAGKLRSISKAADSLDIGQPTVTGHIKKLEAELGTLLFDRIKRPVQLTASGSTLLRLATPLVDGMDQLASGLSEADTMVPVRVASSHEIATHTQLGIVADLVRVVSGWDGRGIDQDIIELQNGRIKS